MREMRDPGITAGEVAHARVIRPRHDLDLVAGRVKRLDDTLGAAQLAFLFACGMGAVATFVERGACRIEIGRVFQVEADGVVTVIALEIDKGVTARIAAHRDLVAAEVGGLALARNQLQPDDLGREFDRALEIARAEPHIADVLEIDHGINLWLRAPSFALPSTKPPPAASLEKAQKACLNHGPSRVRRRLKKKSFALNKSARAKGSWMSCPKSSEK